MTKAAVAPPDLHASIEKLYLLDRNLFNKNPKQSAALYLAACGLICHLKSDQGTLYAARNQISTECPSPEATPAITAVLQNEKLFRTLLQCLLSSSSDSTSDLTHSTSTVADRPGISHQNGHSSGSAPLGRKRAYSFSNEPPSKAMKTSLSPTPNSFSRNKQFDLSKSKKSPTSSWPVQAVVATILYTAMQHLDHWPAPLMRAYAMDSFGPRLWVDDPRCKLLVQNLSLAVEGITTQSSTNNVGDENGTSSSLQEDAVIIADAYRKMESMALPDQQGSLLINSRDSPSKVQQQKPMDLGSDDSDSGDEEECVIDSNGMVVDDATDSSGKGQNNNSRAMGVNGNDSAPLMDTSRLYPIRQRHLNLVRVRQRFFGANREYAQKLVSSSLSSRLDVKTKQNSGLLQSLPSFTAIPGIRSLIARNLEKWLQSPALAGLARTLFSCTVNEMKNVDPPLEEDIKAIDSMLSMKLKANQFNAHMENVSSIARRIPNGSAAHHMYSTLLNEVVNEGRHTVGLTSSDQLKMVGAIHRAIPADVSYDAMAATLLMMLAHPGDQQDKGNIVSAENDNKIRRGERNLLVRKLRSIVGAISFQLGNSFDGYSLMNSLLSYAVSSDSWTTRDEEDKARLMFQCATLSVSSAISTHDLTATISNNRNHQRHQQTAAKIAGRDSNSLSPKAKKSLGQTLKSARKLMLSWCCADYGPRFYNTESQQQRKHKGGSKRGAGGRKEDDLAGAGVPDYSSALTRKSDEERIPGWLSTMRCLLFMEEPSSLVMNRFLFPGGCVLEDDDSEEALVWQDELSRIKCCYDNGVDLDDEMVWIIIKASNRTEGKRISPEMAIQLLENLFQCCTKLRPGSFQFADPMMVWEMYNIVQYTPPSRKLLPEEDITEELQRLAYPGLWWRVTMLALVMCAASTGPIGAIIWKEHPTLRALMKMVTSNRYRFPTVDCDESSRDETKNAEQAARDQETEIAERLFLPPKAKKKKEEKAGSRVSRRLRKQQEAKEAAQELAEARRRKKLLRAAQKSIMIWDPVGPARKPPRAAAELLVSVANLFDLSETFQRSPDPDFLLLTVGETTRGAIERAYSWLIPIISRLPESISRLPSNTSCFLLLRAYGTDGEEQKELKELSAPLLRHVKDSLRGKFGLSDSVTAFDLLMSDVGSPNPDRRRYARKVLQDALADVDSSNNDTKSSWMLNILHVEHAKALVTCSISQMSKAATFERGRVLQSLIIALEKHIAFAEQNAIETNKGFAELMVELISNRPSEFAEAMDAFTDLLSLAIRVVNGELSRHAENSTKEKSSLCDELGTNNVAVMKLNGTSFGAPAGRKVVLPLSLLETTAVILSIWRSKSENADDEERTVVSAVNDLVNAMMRSSSDEGEDFDEDDDTGLAGAKMLDSEVTALSVESWIILAKARSDLIARRAALSAPKWFLPRLLLCSGLPRASLLTMIDRLGRLGDAAEDRGEFFLQLMVPSASSKWDIGRVGQRRDVSRKLLGRLSAYMRLNEVPLSDSKVSVTFLEWLSEECKTNVVKQKRPKKKKNSKTQTKATMSSVACASSILSTLCNDEPSDLCSGAEIYAGETELVEFLPVCNAISLGSPTDMDSARLIIDNALQKDLYRILDSWFVKLYTKSSCLDAESNLNLCELSGHLLCGFRKHAHISDEMSATVLKWVPCLSQPRGDTVLWEGLFSDDGLAISSRPMMYSLVLKCIAMWDTCHISSTIDWIISISGRIPTKYNLDRIILFLVSTSGHRSVHVESFSEMQYADLDGSWGNSEPFISMATSVALARLKRSSNPIKEGFCGQNFLPPCLILLLLLARCGRKQLQSVSNAILEDLSAPPSDESRLALESALLRLYLCFPQSMNLGSSNMRLALMGASEAFANSWSDWLCPLDDQLTDMLEAAITGELKLVRVLLEKSRKHPLLILRKLGEMVRFLENDATQRGTPENDARGVVVQGRDLLEPAQAKVSGRIVQVTVRHWGYSYNESVWIALLDIVSAVPKEVLFSCGRKLGLLDFLALYLQLMSVQLHSVHPRHIALLDSIQSESNPGRRTNPHLWETRFQELCEYKRNHGNCDVPDGYRDNKALANWVKNQRHRRKLLDAGQKAKGMTTEKRDKLDSIGFQWKMTSTTAARTNNAAADQIPIQQQQQQQQQPAAASSRLKPKLIDFFSAFKESSPAGWKDWLGCTVDENWEIRHLLVSCDFITPQEAIDSLKES